MIKKYTYNRLLRKSLPKIFIGDWVSPQGVDHSGRFFSGLALRERERERVKLYEELACRYPHDTSGNRY